MADAIEKKDQAPEARGQSETSSQSTPQAETGEKQPGEDLEATMEKRTMNKQGQRLDGKVEIDEDEWEGSLGFAFSWWKKWGILSVIFAVQVSMNFNAAIYANAISGLTEKFGISDQHARAGQAVFLMTYAFGCEFWAPFSEEFGRWPILQISLGLVNIWQIPCALAPNFATIVAGRFLGGLSSAGGSVTLGMVADLFHSHEQQYAVLFVVLSSVGGSVIGPIVGGFLEQYTIWPWIFWTQLILGGFVQILHFFLVPETRVTVMLDRIAKKKRKEDPDNYGNLYGPNELKERRLSGSELLKVWYRPFLFFFTEPIVLCLSLLSGFSDALIFTFLESFALVFEQWHFNTYQIGLAFLPIAIGYILAYFSFIPDIILQKRLWREKGGENVPAERRLYWLLWEAPLETIGLFGFAFTSYGPMVMTGTNTWIAPMIFASMVGIANFAIYYATIDYMVAAYGPYSASATGGNGFARDFLAGIAAFYATPMYTRINPPYTLEFASMVLGCLAIVVTIPIYIFYWKGQWFREKSKFAQTLHAGQGERGGRRMSSVPGF